jgi:hypothetical protein
MAKSSASVPASSSHQPPYILDQLANLRRRRAAREIDDVGYRHELHLILAMHRFAASA